MHTIQLTQTHTRYSILAFCAAAFWGLYWYPLRQIEAAGVTAAWAIPAIYLIPLVAMLPLCLSRRASLIANWRILVLIGTAIGAALACYAIAFLYTSVLRTVLLFYMTPIWSTLLGIFILHEKNSYQRWAAMAIGFGGLTIMLSSSGQANEAAFGVGDAAALAAGILWGAGTVLVKKSPQVKSADIVPAQYFFATLIGLAFLVLSSAGQSSPLPATTAWLAAMPYIVGFYVVIIVPTIFICIRAAQILSPGRVGILMMSEVLVAGISAPLLAGEMLSGKEWLGGALILAAAILEVTTPAETGSEFSRQ